MMQRINVSLSAPQTAWLKREAKLLDISIGELLRRLIDQARASK